MQHLSGFTQQQNLRLRQIEASLLEVSGGQKGAGGATRAQREAAELAASKDRQDKIDGDLYAVDVLLAQFTCPAHVAPPPPKRLEPGEANSSAVPAMTPAERRRAQRAYSERLYSGSGVGQKMPPRSAGIRIPPVKIVEKRLNELRADPAAQLALHAQVQQHLLDIKVRAAAPPHICTRPRGHAHALVSFLLARGRFLTPCATHPPRTYGGTACAQAERMRQCGGGVPKNFIANNVQAAAKPSRPASAPLVRSPSELLPLDQRPAFRPGGAEYELYARPGPPPLSYQPKPRPQSAAVARTGGAGLAPKVGAFRPGSAVAAPSAAPAALDEGAVELVDGVASAPAGAPPLA